MSIRIENLSDVNEIFEKSESAMDCFAKKDKTSLEEYFNAFNQIDFSVFSSENKEKLANLFVTNAWNSCYQVAEDMRLPIDKFMIMSCTFWNDLAKKATPENQETLEWINFFDQKIEEMLKTVDDGVKHWYFIGMAMWGYLVYSSFATYISPETPAHMIWTIRFIIIIAFGLAVAYKYGSTIPGYIAFRRSLDKIALENILIKFVSISGKVTRNIPDVYIVTKLQGQTINVRRDISNVGLQLFGPVANYLASPLILPIVSFSKIMSKYWYHYEEKEYLNFNLPHLIVRFIKKKISIQALSLINNLVI
jgi:hypothetical protein